MHLLTEVLREKSGLDADGVALVGQALGGDAPKLRVTAFQSESEKNIQRGIEQILRGMYLAIRNPRSHEQVEDKHEDADAIIHFLNYLLIILNASKERFTIEGFLESVSDTEFVESQRYAELLVMEVPVNRRVDCLRLIYDNRLTIEIRKLRYLITALLSSLDEVQLAQYVAAMSEILRSASEFSAIRSALQVLTPEIWPRLAEAPRLRIENKIIKEIQGGEILASGKTTGALGTWAKSFVKRFALRANCARVLIEKLEDTDKDDRYYVARYFFARLPEVLTEEGEIRRAIRAIGEAIRGGDENVRDAVIACARQFPSDWQTQLGSTLQDLTDANNPGLILNDGTPLLQAPPASEITDDDIPF
jgi:uncharacterized protein (TIGR02391 family)